MATHSTDATDIAETPTIPDTDELYSSSYYAANFGIPYERSEHWLNFFGAVADRIIAGVGPTSTLDVGCAFGFLVEALRDRGVDASGTDISSYAIGQVGGSAVGHCVVQSALEPLDRRYDLISCIEVVEHLSPEEGRIALKQMAGATDQILLSTTPHDHAEPTHLNVRPAEYWAEILAEQGMFRDIDHDASYLTPWAGLFVRKNVPVASIVKDYERANARLREEAVALRTAVLEHHARFETLTTEPNRLVTELEHRLAESRASAEEFERELRFSKESYASLERENAQNAVEAAASREALQRTEAELRSARSSDEQSRAALAASSARVEALETSMTWRVGRMVMAPYRKVRGKT